MIHLLHPIFVHFSAAFLVAGGSVEVWGTLARHDKGRAFGGTLVLAGTVSLLFTVTTGIIAANSIAIPVGAQDLLSRHESVGLAVLAVFVLSQFWKGWTGGRVPESQRVGYAALLVLGIVLTVWGAFLGGEMVYARGVGVGAQ